MATIDVLWSRYPDDTEIRPIRGRSLPFTDIVYCSGAVYTSLGFGDIVPIGLCRLYVVLESVTGLVLIAWTASFTFGQMARNWQWFNVPGDRN